MFVIPDDNQLIIFDNLGRLLPAIKLNLDHKVPDLSLPEFEIEFFAKKKSHFESRQQFGPFYCLRRSIRSYPLLGRLKPCYYAREHLISTASRSQRSPDERRAKSFLASCIRSILADLPTIVIDDDLESSLKYGELMAETIHQVMLLNPLLDRVQDKWTIRDAVFQHINYIIGNHRRRRRNTEIPLETSNINRYSPGRYDEEDDDGDFHLVPDITTS